jgi:hypothetical protein
MFMFRISYFVFVFRMPFAPYTGRPSAGVEKDLRGSEEDRDTDYEDEQGIGSGTGTGARWAAVPAKPYVLQILEARILFVCACFMR